ncbi:ABC transporter ATP-binding protein [Coraliomargarita sinensis]|uniref:ABC transporter ATP-binding protein n=1 Tax=Coraliomargarita sinensis TaxID=2174842 RepID=UPI001E48FE67|nr:ABC transporter ATP-binding protein [Coraliomargarita sinensis]
MVKTFPGADAPISVLDGVDFSLRDGESVSIRGESGCGKSTLLNVLSGLETADSGDLHWTGQRVSGLSLSSLAARRASRIGFVFQAYYLAPELNALENVLLAARIAGRLNNRTRERATELLEKVGLGHRIRQSSTKLSGGERQRVAVARALINDPEMIFADEPTGNLDETTAEAVMALLLEMTTGTGKSLVLVTHNAEFAARTEKQYALHLGQLN